jgi:hypothetical protein
MKRVIFLIFVVAVAFSIIARWRHEEARMHFQPPPAPPSAYGSGAHPARPHGIRHPAAESRAQVARSLAEAKAAFAEARHEFKNALGDARNEVHTAIAKARQALASANQKLDAIQAENTAGVRQSQMREDVEGIPVPVVAGTRVTDAVAQPPAAVHNSVAVAACNVGVQAEKAETTATAGPTQSPTRSVEGRLSASEERAKYDAYLMLTNDVRHWLDPQVPQSWAPPVQLLQAMVTKTDVKEIPREYGPMYVATLTYDSSPPRREALVATYNHELVRNRMMMMGGALLFILIALGAVSGYIRADEATKGYYTNRLRMLAATGVGAGGVLIYQMLR